LGKSIVVDIEGAVTKPGVYTLPADARVQDSLIAAGGLSSDADRKGIAKLFNMAAKLTDGGKLYFPFVGESVQTASVGTTGQVAGASTSIVNLNTASEAELDGLPGIGQVTAQKIITNRPYQTVDELTSKKVVTASVFAKIKDLVSVN
jgi:competence protein ComEA